MNISERTKSDTDAIKGNTFISGEAKKFRKKKKKNEFIFVKIDGKIIINDRRN